MTTRKLTPAEALECLRDWYDDDMSCTDWRNKWSHVWPGWEPVVAIGRECLSAIEEDLALAQKPTAGKVKPVYAPCGRRFTLESAVWHGGDEDGAGMPSEVVVYGSGDMGAGEVATYRKVQVGETPKPAAPAPSDEEIVQHIKVMRATGGFASRGEVAAGLSMLARRIGVQGVPQ